MTWLGRIIAAAAVGAAIALPVQAQTLTIGLSAEPSSLDPHFHNLAPNNMVSAHVFGHLVMRDATQKLIPGLAESWRVIDPLIWEFRLRANANWHDGTPVTVDDVIATFERVPNVPRSPSNFSSYTRGRTITKIDDKTMRIATREPSPLLPNDFTAVAIVPKAALNATTEDFNARRMANGAGPYRVVDYVQGDRIVLERFEGWWGPKPDFQRVVMRVIRSEPTRVAALLAGDVDVIEAVPTTDIARLKADQRLSVFEQVGSRVIYFKLEMHRDRAPFVTAKDGSPIANPFKDLRVRQALSKAINREAIAARIMDGAARPASQFVPDFIFGASPRLKPDAFDLEGARRLLAAAGHPNGFRMTIHGPNGRYVNDTKVIEAVAQMWTRLGVETAVETLPPANFFSRASQGADGWPEFGVYLTGWGSSTGEGSDPLRNIAATFDAQAGFGQSNRSRYSNPKVDEMLKRAMATMDDAERARMLAETNDIAFADQTMIPVHWQVNVWAARKGFRVEPRVDEWTLATGVRRQ